MSSRRRLRLVCSSDEEDDDEYVQQVQPLPFRQQQHDDDDDIEIESETLNLQGVSLNSINPNPTYPREAVQIEISDEEFIDATEVLSNSPPPPPPPPVPDQTFHSSEYSTTGSFGVNQTSDSPISRILEDLGLRLRAEWLDACLNGLLTSVPQFSTLDDTKKAKLCFEMFLNSDMNYCSAGLLPSNVHQMHLVDLPGPFVLQVDEIINISQPLRERYKKANFGLKRCLKLCMTDGVQRVFGMEYQPIKDLDALAPSGLKVAISNVNVRHGLLILVPEVFQVLGGLVEELDAARQRLVTEVNKPPRGKRTRTGVVPPLATRATRAAWPANDTSVSPPLSNSVSQNATSMPVDNQVPVNVVPSGSAIPVHRERAGHQPPRTDVESSLPTRRMNTEPIPSTATTGNSVNIAPVNVRVSSSSAVPVHRERAGHQPPRTDAESPFPTRRMSTEPILPTATTRNFINTVPVKVRASSSSAVPVHRERAGHQLPRSDVESPLPTRGINSEPIPYTAATGNSVNMNMENASSVIRETVETVNVETPVAARLAPPAVFSVDENAPMGDSENPFTYLANLSVKWAASKDNSSHVEGKIKCVVTGVKEFQFKNRNTYGLQLYVDDGSLISLILIDHNIVQKLIGCSPQETNAALASSDPSRVQAMKSKMKQFQEYLVNFEGIMVVRINEASSLAVAIDMQQGCSLSDAWLLLRRLKSRDDERVSQLEPIILSP